MLLGSLSIVTNVCDISNQLQLSVLSVCPQKTAFDLKSIWRFLEKKKNSLNTFTTTQNFQYLYVLFYVYMMINIENVMSIL